LKKNNSSYLNARRNAPFHKWTPIRLPPRTAACTAVFHKWISKTRLHSIPAETQRNTRLFSNNQPGTNTPKRFLPFQASVTENTKLAASNLPFKTSNYAGLYYKPRDF